MLTKKLKEAAKKLVPAKPVPYVLKDKYLQVTIDGKPSALDSTHPTFKRMKEALVRKNWKAVPKLVTLAQEMFSNSQGNVSIVNGVVYYKGSPVNSALTQRIIEMLDKKLDIGYMMKFMDNWYRNPYHNEIGDEFHDWLKSNNLPITDDGCFLAYKSVDDNLLDQHTHSIDNSPGQVIMMPRKYGDQNWRQQCSRGFHVCSKQYGLYGSRVMAVKVNPRDVLSAFQGKLRVLRYEVLRELGTKDKLDFEREGFNELENRVMVEVGRERKELISMILKSKQAKRAIASGKIKESTIKKAAHARLTTIARNYGLIESEPVKTVQKSLLKGTKKGTGSAKEMIKVTKGEVISLLNLPPLEAARKGSGLTVGQIAQEMGRGYKEVAKLEKQIDPNQQQSDAFLEAIHKLKGLRTAGGAVIFKSALTLQKEQ